MRPMIWGMAALAYFGPDIKAALGMPKLISVMVPTGLLGIVLAGMLAASISTYSSYLLSWSAVASRDIIAPLKKKPLSEASSIKISRVASFLIGLFLLIFGFLYEIPETAYQYLVITGTIYASGAFAVVAGGLYWKKANSKGAYAALLTGVIMPLLFLGLEKFKSSLPEWTQIFTNVNLSGFIGMLLPVFAIITVSLLTQKSCPAKVMAPYLQEES
jgi:solute:Na+ symporter, SSS family